MNILRTARLNFKLMDENDGALLFDLDNDPAVMEHLTRGQVSTMNTIKDVFIPRMQAYRHPQQGWGLWQVNLNDNDSFIGWILIRPMGFFTTEPDFSDIEIGWRFKRVSWGKGYASEAAAAVADAVTKNGDVKTLSATALKANSGSIKIMKKLGMKFIEHYNHRDEFGELPAVLYRKSV
ncbi:GNAT family N-acetyltransferase [Pseudoalteromonas arctica]|uniref:GNAT family N-acetyltransferase n=1 Tax=Pseudoalteromonas arctica TaxID=394751 RepID=A0A7Y0HAN4_9GAMM|nr:GNAT family N-acetyltransferase [Pseudoalteromonas arctica]NMM40806.1 GNAT family N-acetyltransferase [Pseudoalteromonas arctica]